RCVDEMVGQGCRDRLDRDRRRRDFTRPALRLRHLASVGVRLLRCADHSSSKRWRRQRAAGIPGSHADAVRDAARSTTRNLRPRSRLVRRDFLVPPGDRSLRAEQSRTRPAGRDSRSWRTWRTCMTRTALVSGVFVALWVMGSDVAQAAPAPTVSSVLPDDVAIPNGFGGNPIEFFDDFSWRSFIALNWPAQTPGPAGATRGVADAAAAFGDTTKPLLWESWKTDWEMIPGANCLGDAAGCAIRPWNEMGENPCGTPSSPDTKVLAAFSTFENLAQAGFGNLEGPIV